MFDKLLLLALVIPGVQPTFYGHDYYNDRYSTQGIAYTDSKLRFPILAWSEEKMFSKTFEPRHEKTNVLVSDLVRHKPGCTATEDG